MTHAGPFFLPKPGPKTAFFKKFYQFFCVLLMMLGQNGGYESRFDIIMYI